MTPTACPSCGASVRPGSPSCDLCGTAVADGPARSCDACGHTPPGGSQFCNACGNDLGAVEPSARPDRPATTGPPARPRSDVGRRAFLVAAVGIAVVVGLYAVTALSGNGAADAETEGTDVAPAAPIAGEAPPLPDTLQAAADRFEAEGTASGWYEAGRFYLTAAFNATATDPTASVQWARQAVRAFEESLRLQEDPDVRVALAEAAAFDPADPMRPVVELQAVLSEDPDHVGANLEMGERRFLIGRLDSARVSFERVVALTDPGDPMRAQAEAALALVAAAEEQPEG